MRLTPRSLKGQLIALTLLALVVSQFVGLLFILNDRKSTLTKEWFHNVLTRTSTVVDVLDSTPQEYHQKILKSVSLFNLKFTVEPNPLTTEMAADNEDHDLHNEIRKVFGDRTDKVAITVYTKLTEETRFELLFGDMWRDLRRSLFKKSRLLPKAPARPTYARISIALKSGEWLDAIVMPKGFAPPASPLLAQLLTMAVFSALGIIAVINRVTKPLKELAEAAAALGRGETGTKLVEKGPYEVIDTVRAFNEMQDRLGRFVHDRTKMLAALGHDLRTPITSLRLRAEFIEDDEMRFKIIETLDDMLQMAEATLSFAREEAAQEETRLVDLGALVSTVCADLADTGLEVACQDSDQIKARCRPVGVKRALRNVVENAVAYGRCARVSVVTQAGEAIIEVDDDGPGIPEEDVEKVFKPFVRLEHSRSRDTGGVGLGLSIARSIVRSHGGDIMLRNRGGGGLRVIISMPVAPSKGSVKLAPVASPDADEKEAA